MAYYNDQEDDELNPNGSQTGIQISSPSGMIGAQGQGSGGAGTSITKAPNAPDTPGNFVGIQQYLNANKPQAAKLGDQVTGVINQSADQARQSVQSLNQEAQEKVRPVSQLSEDVKNKISTTAEALSPQERQTIKNTQSAVYKGPQEVASLQSYQSAADATNKAKTNIEQSGTEQGRMGLISQVNSKPRTQGMNTFDNALLSAGGGREKLSQASQANQDIFGGLQNTSTNIQNQIGRADDPNTPDVDESSGAIGQTKKAQTDAFKTVQDALMNWKNAFQPRVHEAQNAYTQRQQAAVSDIADNPYVLDPETMAALGLNNGERIYGLDLNTYLNPGSPSDINAANLASTEDYARYGALADLAGESDLFLNPSNASQAGTAPQFGANKERLQHDVQAARDVFNQLAGRTTLSKSDSQTRGSGSTAFGTNASASQSIADYLANGFNPHVSADMPMYFNDYEPNREAYYAAIENSKQSLFQEIVNWLSNNNYNSAVMPSTIPYPNEEQSWRDIVAPIGGAGNQPPPIFNPDEELLKKKGTA